ncbi:hypothetical protein HDK77DRAFT_428860 [Phyllosticta capitalensis]
MVNGTTVTDATTTMTTSTPASAPPAAAALGMWEMVLVQMVPPLADTRLEVRYRDDDDDALKLHRDVDAGDEMLLEGREGLDLGLSLGLGWERESDMYRGDGHVVCSGRANDDDNDGFVNGVEVAAALAAPHATTTTTTTSASPCLPTASIAFTQPLDNGASVSLLPQNNNNDNNDTSTRVLVLQMLITLLLSLIHTTIYTIIALTLSLSLAKRTERFLLTQRKALLKRQIKRLKHAMRRTARARLDRIVECCCGGTQHGGNFQEACDGDAVVRALEDEEGRLGHLVYEKTRELGRTRACLRALERAMARGPLRWRRGRAGR